MDMDTQPLEMHQMEQRASETALKINRAFTALPPAYKRNAMFADYTLVFAGLKAGTDYAFLGDTYTPVEFEVFKSVFTGLGLRVTEPHTSQSKTGDFIRQGLIYNPKTLEEITRNSQLILPYNQSETLETWVERCKTAGMLDGAIYGKVYSFPESAIRDYLSSRSNQPQNTTVVIRQETSVHTGGETYLYFKPAQEDVVKRELAKEALFIALEAIPAYKALSNSPVLKQSDELWSARLPEWTRRRK